MPIALFTVDFSHLHYNAFERGCEAILGSNRRIGRKCITSTFKYAGYLHTIQPRSQGLCRQIKKEREKPWEQGWENQT